MGNRFAWPGALIGSLVLAGTASGSSACPAPVITGAQKAFATAKILSCVAEHEAGKVRYEVKVKLAAVALRRADGRIAAVASRRVELDLDPQGALLQTEERVSLVAVPPGAMLGFQTHYPGAKPTQAEKQTRADGTLTFEIAFERQGRRREATFTPDGKFIEEE